VSTLPTVLRPLLIALLALALLPAAASAAVIDIQVSPKDGAYFGDIHTVTGKITGPYGAPLVGRQVQLEAKPFPFRHRPYTVVETAMSGLDGRFAFDHAFDRNQRLRVFAPEFGDRSAVEPAYVFPSTDLTYTLFRRNVIRLVQAYRTPANVRLTKPTLFYVGKAGHRKAPLAARAPTRPLKRNGKRVKGRFRAIARVRIPKAWKGRFRYASCFPYNAGMGNPRLGCPKKNYKF
jgi:hypothetical protein